MGTESGPTPDRRSSSRPDPTYDALCAIANAIGPAERGRRLVLQTQAELAGDLGVTQPGVNRAIRRMRLEGRIRRILAGGVTRYAVAISGGWRTSESAQQAIVTEAALSPSESTDHILERVADAFALARYKGAPTPPAGSPTRRVVVDPRAGEVPEELLRRVRRSWARTAIGDDARVVLLPPLWDVQGRERGIVLLRLVRQRRLVVLGFVDREGARGEAWAVPEWMLAQAHRLTQLARWLARESQTT